MSMSLEEQNQSISHLLSILIFRLQRHYIIDYNRLTQLILYRPLSPAQRMLLCIIN